MILLLEAWGSGLMMNKCHCNYTQPNGGAFVKILLVLVGSDGLYDPMSHNLAECNFTNNYWQCQKTSSLCRGQIWGRGPKFFRKQK